MSPASDFRSDYRAARDGDRAAFERLVERYRDRLKRFVERRMGAQVRRRTEPEDVVQNVVLTLLARLERYPEDLEEDELLAYVLQIAKWRIADVLKKGTQEGGESVLPVDAAGGEVVSSGPVTRADERRWTREQIDTLPESYAEVLRLYYVEGLAVADIAERLELSSDNVKQRLSRGRTKLRKRMSS